MKIQSAQRPIFPESPLAEVNLPRNLSASNRFLYRFKTFSFRNQVATIALLFATLPTLAVGAMSYHLLDRSITAATETQQTTAKLASHSIQSYLKQRQSELQAIATLPILNDSRIWSSLSQEDKIAAFNRATQTYQAFSHLAVFEPNGTVLLQSKPQSISNQAKESYFQTALKSDNVSLSDPIEIEGQSIVYFSAPIKDVANGKTIAVVRATLPTQTLVDVFPATYSIVDRSNRFVIASDQNRAAITTFSDSTSLESQFWTNEQTQQRLFLTQVPVKAIDQLPALNWRLIVSTTADQVSEPSRLWLLLLSSGTAGVSGLLAIVIAYLITHRLTMMKRRLPRLLEGDVTVRMKTTGTDEIALLGQAIGQMAETLSTANQEQSNHVQRLQRFHQAAFNIRNAQGFDEIVQTGVQEVRQLLKVDRAVVYLFDQNWQGTIVAESVSSEFPAALGARIADPCFAERYIEKYQAGRVHSIANLEEANLDPCYRGQLEPFQVKANLVAPMLVEGKLMGLLVAHQCRAPRQWKASETDVFVQVALHLGYAIEQVNLAADRETALAQAALVKERQQQKDLLRTQLLELMKQAEKAASGDLTVRARVNDAEIGTVADFFNAIVENLQQVVQQVKQSVLQVNESLYQHESAVRSLSEDALKQAEETHLTLDCIDQMVKSIHTVANHAQQAATVSQTAAQTAEAGEFAMSETAQSIAELRQSISEATKKVKRLGESAQQISKAVLLINQIEMQTNVLAINAGIEASRTEGNHGFTMIAEEVSALAGRASAATHEISQLVRTIQQETIEVVDAMEKSTAQVVTGTQSVESAKQSLEQILQVSHQIDQIVHSISEATVSQVSTSNTVTNLMNTIAEVAKHTSSSSLEVSSSLRETVSVAKELEESVQTFKVSV
ncbi:methyl-accepting chemotaxis protein [Leptolyngbya sp. NIES-2104]|uniref:methyl-accepting chemotaxis protein n=1 Tax=Leptolyngbya sp. NIES-2104 TaxID=1552121 RepID=UPI0006EC55BF|nr:methyl-accepting chemotaxis protein [Leptolyngbya sp. NIES-2104]GAP98757.1 methyl-accepting chemotaxis protein [Leptolyngbya sp. NIES-2104]